MALGKSTAHVSSWLSTSGSATQDSSISTVDNDPSKTDFFNLPIIGEGSGLSLGVDAAEEDQINTIGDYVKSGKSLASLKNKKQRKSRPNGIQNRITKTDSKALNALRNKMRNTQRGTQKEKSATEQLLQKGKPQVIRSTDSDDDDDDEVVQKSTKKSFTSFLDSKIKPKQKSK